MISMVFLLAFALFVLGCVACPVGSSVGGRVSGKREMVDTSSDLPIDDSLAGFIDAPTSNIQIQAKSISHPAQPLSIVLLSLSITFLAVLSLGVALYVRNRLREKRRKDGWELMPRFEKGVSWREGDSVGDTLRDARELEDYEVGLAKKRLGKLKGRSFDGAEAERVTATANPWARPPTLVNTVRRGETHLIDLSEPLKKEEVLVKRDSWEGETWGECGWGEDGEGDVALREIGPREERRGDGPKHGVHLTSTDDSREGPLVDLSEHMNPHLTERQDSTQTEEEEEDVVEETHSRRTSAATLVDVNESDGDSLPLVDISPKTISKLPSKLSNLLVLMDPISMQRRDENGNEDILVDTSVPVSPRLAATSVLFPDDLLDKAEAGLVGFSLPPSPIGVSPRDSETEIRTLANASVSALKEEYAPEVGQEEDGPQATFEVDKKDDIQKAVVKGATISDSAPEFDDEDDTMDIIVECDKGEDNPEIAISNMAEVEGVDEYNLNVVLSIPQVSFSSVIEQEMPTDTTTGDHAPPATTQDEPLHKEEVDTYISLPLPKLVTSPTADEEEDDDNGFHDTTIFSSTPPLVLISPPPGGYYSDDDDEFRDALSTTPFITPYPTPISPISPLPDVADIHTSPLSTPKQVRYPLPDTSYADPPLPEFPAVVYPSTVDALNAPDPDDLPLPDMPLPGDFKHGIRRSPLQTRDMNVGGLRPAWSVRAMDSPALGVATSTKGNISSPSSPVGSETSDGGETPKASSSPVSEVEAPSSEPSSPSQPTEPSAPESPSPTAEVASTPKQPRAYRAFPQFDIALAMQLRPGLGVGADPAWMVRFLMSMFGWFAVMLTGQVRRRESTVR